MRNLIIGTAAALALGAGAAQAAPITYTDSFGLSTTELVGSLSVPQFDSSLGTLNSVSWSVNRIVDGVINVTNTSGSTQSGDAGTQVQFDLTNLSPGPFLWDLEFDTGLTVEANTGPLTLASGEATGPINVTGSELSSGTVPGSALGGLSSWIGSGNVGFDFATDTALVLRFGGGNVSADQSTQANIILDVTYDFTPDDPPGETVIPVPAALPLLATAIGALGVWRVRRKA
ncbi:MAG: choice-of-anchor E domain-containing protein [Paracoccaceae bacterium]